MENPPALPQKMYDSVRIAVVYGCLPGTNRFQVVGLDDGHEIEETVRIDICELDRRKVLSRQLQHLFAVLVKSLRAVEIERDPSTTGVGDVDPAIAIKIGN